MTKEQRSITLSLLIATFLSAIEVTIISTAMPVITQDLGGIEHISWVFAIYLLTTAVTTPIFGKLSDLFGRKIVFNIGVIIFLIGSALCGISQNMEQLIVFRGIQGFGAGALMPVIFAIVGDIFNYEQRAKVMGSFSSIWAVSGIFGPLAGGFIVDYFTWHWIFYINVPFGLLALWMFSKHFREIVEKKKRRIDYGGAVTFMIGMTVLLYAWLSGGNAIAWKSLLMLELFLVAVLFLGIFAWIQMRHPEPLLDFALFKNRAIAVSNTSGFLLSALLIGLTAYLPLWIQGVLLLGATYSGLTLIPMSLGWPLAAFLSGRLMMKTGARPLAIVGVVCIAIGTIALTFISVTTPHWILVIIMFIIGFGFGLSMTVFTVAVQSSVETARRGVATSSNSFMRILGQALGIALLGTILNQHIGGSIDGHSAREVSVPPELLANGLLVVFGTMVIIAIGSLLITIWMPKQSVIH